MKLTEIFWTFFVGTIAGLIFGLFKMCLKSKCDNVSCCCIKIHRDISAESKLDEIELAHPQSNTSL